MKVIFLDIDGVLNEFEDIRLANTLDCVSREKIARLNRIIDATGAVCVLSSSWRIIHSLDWMREFLKEHGFTGQLIDKTINYTGILSENRRGYEIHSWLMGREVDSFIILDDADDMEPHLDRLVQTSFYSFDPDEFEPEGVKGGLQDEHVKKAIKMLNNDPSR